MVIERHFFGQLHKRRCASRQNARTKSGVSLHHFKLCWRQRTRLQQNRIRNRNFADVMQTGSRTQSFGPCWILAEQVSNLGTHVANACSVFSGVGVSELSENRQPFKGFKLELFKFSCPTTNQAFELARAQSQNFCLLARFFCFVSNLQCLNTNISAFIED